MRMSRRAALAGATMLAFSPTLAHAQPARTHAISVRRNPGCGCCHLWGEILERGGFSVAMTEDADMPAYKRALGVPDDLVSCHTGVVGGYVVEGHVPAEDILRLLRQRPPGVIGLAVPGMPIGSPGMEVPSGRRDAYDVIAFRHDGSRSVFARHEAGQHQH